MRASLPLSVLLGAAVHNVTSGKAVITNSATLRT
jgi:hypothetical protein